MVLGCIGGVRDTQAGEPHSGEHGAFSPSVQIFLLRMEITKLRGIKVLNRSSIPKL